MDIGVGTLVTNEQIEKAAELGVDFMVSPGISKALAPTFESCGIPFIPGVATPSEIITGLELGWDTFKFFPAHLFGGLDALKTYGQVFPQVKFCPTGGIKADTYEQYLSLSNVISVGGSWLQ
jgi:2-dehydro-3-deoxyphosphogluconate aldolase/(4S)-4-hydroxy-2-oxoglutarate aldolase